jgi:hypothetical protein
MSNQGKQWAKDLSEHNRIKAELQYGLITYADIFIKHLKALGNAA